MIQTDRIAVGFLAGGKGSRMGGCDKALLTLGGTSILTRQIEKTSAYPVRMINANGDLSRYGEFGLPVIADSQPGFLGPLAGVLSCLEYLRRSHPQVTHLASMATDAPFIPDNLPRLLADEAERTDAEIIQPQSGGRRHPVFSLWQVSLCDALHHALTEEGIRKIDLFTAQFTTSVLSFENISPDPFLNLNRPEDHEYAEQLMKAE